MHSNILNEKQLELAKKLDFLPSGMYLAGGTALALQLGHRTSLDFDFYINDHFDSQELAGLIQEKVSQTKLERVLKDTLLIEVDGVSCSFFYYPYKLLKKTIPFEGIRLAAVEDIAAMKMIAISMRGKRRDFIDAYFLLKRFSLEEMIKFTLKKYPSYQPLMVLKGLIFFNDAEDEDLARGIKVIGNDFSWEKAKKKIFGEVQKYQLGMFR